MDPEGVALLFPSLEGLLPAEAPLSLSPDAPLFLSPEGPLDPLSPLLGGPLEADLGTGAGAVHSEA